MVIERMAQIIPYYRFAAFVEDSCRIVSVSSLNVTFREEHTEILSA